MMPQGPVPPVRRTEFYEEHQVPWQRPIRIVSAGGMILLCALSAIIMFFAALSMVTSEALLFLLLWMTNWVLTGYLGLQFGAVRGGFGGVIAYGAFCSLIGILCLIGFAMIGSSGSTRNTVSPIIGIVVGSIMGPLIYGLVTRAWALSLLDRAFMPVMPMPPPGGQMRPMAPSAVRTPYPMTPEAQQFWTSQQPGNGMPPPPHRPPY